MLECPPLLIYSISRLTARPPCGSCAASLTGPQLFIPPCGHQAAMGAVRVLVTTNSSPTATVPVESAPRFHPKNTSCFQEPIADHPKAFPDLQALRMTQPICGVDAGACKIHKKSFHLLSALNSGIVPVPLCWQLQYCRGRMRITIRARCLAFQARTAQCYYHLGHRIGGRSPHKW